jgi:pyrimidine-specific ribonucleoside hydrolase
MTPMNIAFDMETSDPDDVLTLCILATHPAVILRAATVTPGSRAQVGLVRHVLDRLGKKDTPVGSRRPDHPKECVSEFHYVWLGRPSPMSPDGLGSCVLQDILHSHPDTVIVTGASLGNISALLATGVTLQSIFIQGGFAGDSVVPEEFRLEKFRGKETCATFNLNGDIPAAKDVLSNERVLERHLISKNVCHGVVYDSAMHERMMAVENPNPGFAMMREGMVKYLAKHPAGKAFHDPLAACTAIDPGICQFARVELYKGEWGSRLVGPGLPADSNTHISISYDRDRFERTLSGQLPVVA